MVVAQKGNIYFLIANDYGFFCGVATQEGGGEDNGKCS